MGIFWNTFDEQFCFFFYSLFITTKPKSLSFWIFCGHTNTQLWRLTLELAIAQSLAQSASSFKPFTGSEYVVSFFAQLGYRKMA